MNNLKDVEDALRFKVRAAHYHKIMSERAGMNNITNYEEFNVSAMEFTAMMSTLHSILDIIAQWINQKYELKIPNYDVSFKKIINDVDDYALKMKIVKLKEDSVYLDDFCNYIKHRNIVRVNHQWYFVSPFQPAVLQTIESFKKSKIKHPEENLYLQRDKQFELIYSAVIEITGLHITLASTRLS
ncbi:Cthe_2314 family HEPN domain-containing protein [Evansella tamaricis]|uniref:Cthe-2314-like HEPN domain-containing protein n=1 Tax=Evansella tamaricis TaxID=2069301 RepID=A0ABS6JFD5_9BACI|nr:Cthe_2314 family HEPN domain-containing protein [Evansella tamaricis]MBU9711053.1 hypothetical protein [Evansella tamaricis]